MAGKRRQSRARHIAIAIELDEPYPHHYECCRGIRRYADQRGDWLTAIDPHLVGVTGEGGVAQYDGIVGRIGRHAAKEAEARGIPAVNHWLNTPARGLPSVFPDYREAGRIAGEHLLARGFRRFGYVGMARDRIAPLVLDGFERAIRAEGFDPPSRLGVPRDFEKRAEAFARFRKRMRQWVEGLTPPVGVLVAPEVAARYLAQICSELDLRVPLDVGIVSQYNAEMPVLGFEPTLSSVDHDFERIGYRAAQLLDELINTGGELPSSPILIGPKGLTVRASSDAFVVADPLVAKALSFISDHARAAVTVEDVAEHLGTTTRTLARRFRRHLGRPVSDEINRLRIEYIKRRLEDPDLRLGVLARECGFHSPSHFALFFRKMTGMRPKDYRAPNGR